MCECLFEGHLLKGRTTKDLAFVGFNLAKGRSILLNYESNQSDGSFQVYKLLCGKAKNNFIRTYLAGAERLSHLLCSL